MRNSKVTKELSQLFSRASSLDERWACFTAVHERARCEVGHSYREVWPLPENAPQSSTQLTPLTAIPYSLKDNILTVRGRTCAGSRMLEEFSSPYDATCFRLLEAAGAQCIGKSNMDEFSIGATGQTCCFAAPTNPWRPHYNPGGSSTGAATGVASGAACFSLGTDSGGSVRQPAAHCGVLGLKPTYGCISRFGVIALCSSTDTVGIMARHASDLRVVLSVLSRADNRDLQTLRATKKQRTLSSPSVKGLLFGIPSSLEKYCDEEILIAFDKTKRELETIGVHFEEIDFSWFKESLTTYNLICAAEAFSNLARFDGIRFGSRPNIKQEFYEAVSVLRSSHFGYAVRERVLFGAHVLSAEKLWQDAIEFRRQLTVKLTEITSQCNGIFLPATPTGPRPLSDLAQNPELRGNEDVLLAFSNLSGQPALSFPVERPQSDLPVGMQLVGRHWDEATLLSVVEAYQSESQHHLAVATPREHPVGDGGCQ